MKELATQENHKKTCMYLLRISNYVVDIEEHEKVLRVAFDIFKQCNALPDALRVAMKLNSRELMSDVFSCCKDELLRKQLGFILSGQRIVLDEFEDDDDMMEIMGNSKVRYYYVLLSASVKAHFFACL